MRMISRYRTKLATKVDGTYLPLNLESDGDDDTGVMILGTLEDSLVWLARGLDLKKVWLWKDYSVRSFLLHEEPKWCS